MFPERAMEERGGAGQSTELTTKFHDRADAGRKLAIELKPYAGDRPVVVALARGGVPIGREVALALHAPLEVCVVRKLGLPWQPELGVGAVAQGGYVHIDYELVDHTGLTHRELSELTEREQRNVEALVRKLGLARRPDALMRRTVLLVDDGIATGGTVAAAILALRAEQPRKIVLAVPVASPTILPALEAKVERVVALLVPEGFSSVSACYEDFAPVSDDDVIDLIRPWRGPR